MEGGPAGVLYDVNESGWMDAVYFSFLVPKAPFPSCESTSLHWPSCIVLWWTSPAYFTWANLTCYVHLLCLPRSTTHILQPLDVGTFSSVKKARKILKRWKLQTRGQTVSKDAFPSLSPSCGNLHWLQDSVLLGSMELDHIHFHKHTLLHDWILQFPCVM